MYELFWLVVWENVSFETFSTPKRSHSWLISIMTHFWKKSVPTQLWEGPWLIKALFVAFSVCYGSYDLMRCATNYLILAITTSFMTHRWLILEKPEFFFLKNFDFFFYFFFSSFSWWKLFIRCQYSCKRRVGVGSY